MRGQQDPQVTMLGFVDLEARVAPDHPLRTIKALANRALAALSPESDRMYAVVGRPSIPPERLLKVNGPSAKSWTTTSSSTGFWVCN